MLEDKRISNLERREQKNNKDSDQHSYLNLYLYFFPIMQIINTNFVIISIWNLQKDIEKPLKTLYLNF